jgi:hypothetical protein
MSALTGQRPVRHRKHVSCKKPFFNNKREEMSNVHEKKALGWADNMDGDPTNKIDTGEMPGQSSLQHGRSEILLGSN